MLTYLLKRLGGCIVLLLLLSFLLYAILALMPGDPLDTMLSADPRLTAEDIARLKAIYGLDKPVTERYARWLWSALHGEWGYSRLYNRPTVAVLAAPLKASVAIMLPALLLALLLSGVMAIAAAARPGRFIDRFATVIAMLSIAMPTFWVGLLLLLLFSVTLQWLPGSVLDVMPGAPWYQRVPAYILPVATLAFGMTGGYIRYLRGSLREVLPMPYIRTAVAKGAARRRVLYGHALQNASLPAVTIVALSVGGLFSGALITETLFGINGLGRLVYEAINGNDYNLAIAALLLSTACVLLCNLIADLLYAWLDPRISHAG